MIQTRLSIMMFLQFFIWGAWFVTLGHCLGENNLGDFGGGSYGSAPIAAIIAPLFLGLIADRFFASERVMGVLFLLGGVLMGLGYMYAAEGNGEMMVWMFIGHMLCYMPSLGLSNTITFTHVSDQNDFPKIRVWGTIGWIVAGLFVGFMDWSTDLKILSLAAGGSILMGLYCFSLPHTPPPARDKPINIRTLLMFDAIKLMARFPFLVFIICSTLICIPLAYYYGIASMYLGNAGFLAPASAMTVGQMSEIFFMLLIPFFFRRLGVKTMILVGMLAWVLRYALFAMGADNQEVWMLFAAIALHGICYDFFFVTGFMYTDKVANKDVRGQAQGMLVFFTQGVGMYFGYWIAFAERAKTVTQYDDLTAAIEKTHSGQLSFVDKLNNMFSVEIPAVDGQLFTETMAQWREFWWLPTIMAGIITAIFFVFFWDKVDVGSDGASTENG
ncbi:MAG TPA: MFS transporter [Pirellulales bacterium]|nr:MFS transporter [Pirellulales bacterium]